ncbi:hypothetical protein KL928_002716 [Ogataea angusta]|uniref:AB hydrolase-1 domain-containing protein n=1 Tax=Pichia angusta TaxID=870730 RepID=A0AAN6I5N5_PICAN|nr:uncharacterized protein KL928_002716 [Ogataea angusta]KAG7818848.1 hypothetical protein KL928_002716 [Ogataea angusta]KAG7834588.1 hypothetical protein KL943_002972 [Ogataea angusta]
MPFEELSYSVEDSFVLGDMKVSILRFLVPLDYTVPDSTISICVKLVNSYKYGEPTGFVYEADISRNLDHILLYLQGGPGYESEFPSDASRPTFLSPLLRKGYTVLLLDQRGTGLSTPIHVAKLLSLGSAENQLHYLECFRADSIIRDCEQIRLGLVGRCKWTLLGYSYGGFCSICYCSMFPEALKKVLIFAGLPPLTGDLTQISINNLATAKRRTLEFYEEYPGNKQRVERIVDYLKKDRPALPNGGVLSPERFQQLGMHFATVGGFGWMNKLVVTMTLELQTTGQLSYTTLKNAQDGSGFDSNLLYFFFQEAIYMNGNGSSSQWFVNKIKERVHDDGEFYFTSEHHYPGICDDFQSLRSLKPLLELVHTYDRWDKIWDLSKLRNVTLAKLPVYCLLCYDDQYVSTELALANSSVFEFKRWITTEYLHDGIIASGEEVVDKLFRLVEGRIPK